ncbi:MAG: ABC transporter permease [Bacillota bacterium]|nr:MAG: ABC transporter permease [Bacillota bacterium]
MNLKNRTKIENIKKIIKQDILGYIFILPVVLGILIFSIYPMFSSLYFSFFKYYNGIKPPSGFGIFNYQKLFIDPDVILSLKITFTYAIVVIPLSLALSFILAMFLNQDLKGIGVFRVLCYMPVIIPATVLGLLFSDFFNVRFGLANKILSTLGLPTSLFFESSSSALITFMSTSLWGLGGSMILWLAALKNVPTTYYEAAKIDGASFFRRTFFITIPMCSNMIFYNLIMGIIGMLQTFSAVFTMTGGSAGPENCLLFFAMKIYYTAFSDWNMGYASALAWVMFLIIALLTGIVFKTSKWVFYGEDS